MPPVKKAKTKSDDRLFQIFRDTEVYVAMKSIKGDLLNDGGASSNALFFGVLMDCDDTFFYLGTGDEVTAAVQKIDVAAVLDRSMLDDQMTGVSMAAPDGTEFQ